MKRHVWLLPLQFVFAAVALACDPAVNEDLNNDGQVDFSDTLIVARSFRLTQGDPRYNPLADIDCNGAIDRDDLNFVKRGRDKTYPVKPFVNGFMKMPPEMTLTAGESGTLQVFVKMDSRNEIPFNVNLEQTSSPGQGLRLRPPTEEPDAAQTSLKHTYRIPVEALEPGSYKLTTTAVISQSGQRFSDTTAIEIMPPKRPVSDALTLTLTRSNGGGQQSGPSLLARVTTEDEGIGRIERMEIRDEQEQRSWKLTVTGRNRYNARLQFSGPPADRCMTLMAVATTENGEIASPGVRYCFDERQSASTEDGMNLSLPAASLTPPPKAGVLAEVTFTGTLRDTIARVDIHSKADRNRWTLPQKGIGIFRGRLTFSGARPAQCFELVAEGFDRAGRLIASESHPQPLCPDGSGENPASP